MSITVTGSAHGEIRAEQDMSKVAEWLALIQFIIVGRLDFATAEDPGHRKMLKAFVLPAFLPIVVVQLGLAGGRGTNPADWLEDMSTDGEAFVVQSRLPVALDPWYKCDIVSQNHVAAADTVNFSEVRLVGR